MLHCSFPRRSFPRLCRLLLCWPLVVDLGQDARADDQAELLGTSPPAALRAGLRTAQPVLLQEPVAAQGGEEGEDGEGGIKDNSFLVEEAYNQEPGIVQHIFNWVRGWDFDDTRTRTFDFVFTQEWPIGSESHQFSYTIPISSVFEHPAGGVSSDEAGLGDILLNYRYALSKETECCPAIAPRLSLLLPSGDEERGLGTGEAGFQFNLPISKEVGRWAVHANAGFTVIPDVVAEAGGVRGRPRHTLNAYNLGASAIWLARDDLNFLLETVTLWDEGLSETGSVDHSFELLLSPGVRWAPYTAGDTQWVVGVGLPVGLTRDAPDISLFFYMSFEHRFQRSAD